eukprot:8987948-Ditylum_brightwellii.AAC.1
MDVFDQLFNSRNIDELPPLSNETIVSVESPDGPVTYTLGHIAAFLDLQFQVQGNSSVVNTFSSRFIASVLMAIFDFNTGHNSIVPEISQC